MKFINFFFNKIIGIQVFLGKFEEWHQTNRKKYSWIIIGNIVLAFALAAIKQIILGEIVFLLGMFLIGIDNIIGWKYSVRKWLKLCVVYNLVFSIILACLIQNLIKTTIWVPLFIGLYLFIWVLLSLISNSKVALLVNEIVSGMVATVFTIGTYLISNALKGLPSSEEYILYYNNEEELNLAFLNGEMMARKFFDAGVLELLEGFFLAFLPVIGVSALSIIAVKIKIYWMEKNKKCEPENDTDLLNDDKEELS